jgi:hypothetical protein
LGCYPMRIMPIRRLAERRNPSYFCHRLSDAGLFLCKAPQKDQAATGSVILQVSYPKTHIEGLNLL